ncbi:hypothetical protein [Sporolactobacillus shoreae]|nr:hypothetical protein [Sporolactobacillus shoreae]
MKAALCEIGRENVACIYCLTGIIAIVQDTNEVLAALFGCFTD